RWRPRPLTPRTGGSRHRPIGPWAAAGPRSNAGELLRVVFADTTPRRPFALAHAVMVGGGPPTKTTGVGHKPSITRWSAAASPSAARRADRGRHGACWHHRGVSIDVRQVTER